MRRVILAWWPLLGLGRAALRAISRLGARRAQSDEVEFRDALECFSFVVEARRNAAGLTP